MFLRTPDTSGRNDHVHEEDGFRGISLRADRRNGRSRGLTRDRDHVRPSDPNPDLTSQCGLDFALILDSSGSIGSTGIANLKSASNAFVESLADTGSNVSVTSFATASPGVGGTNLAPTALTTVNLPTIKGSYKDLSSNGMTNWQDGFLKSQASFPGFAPADAPDLAVLITDGNPNTINNPTPPPEQQTSYDASPEAVNPAIAVANQMKAKGVHMFGIAVQDGQLGDQPDPDQGRHEQHRDAGGRQQLRAGRFHEDQ